MTEKVYLSSLLASSLKLQRSPMTLIASSSAMRTTLGHQILTNLRKYLEREDIEFSYSM